MEDVPIIKTFTQFVVVLIKTVFSYSIFFSAEGSDIYLENEAFSFSIIFLSTLLQTGKGIKTNLKRANRR